MKSHLAARAPVFVTGGSGFLGQRLIRDLIAKKHPVRALARSKKAASVVESCGAEPVAGDLSNVAAMSKGMQGCPVVIHAAAKVELWGPWEAFERDTVQGTANVIEAARAASVDRLVHVSTEAVLAAGRPLCNIDESIPLPVNPNGDYPKSKALAEGLVRAANGCDLHTVITRPRLIWGKGDTTLLPELVASVNAGQWLWFGGDHLTSTCHVANASHGTILAARHGVCGEAYFLTDGLPVSFKAFVSQLLKTQGVVPPEREAPLWLASRIAAAMETWWRITGREGNPSLTKTAVNLFFSEVTIKSDKAEQELGYHPVMSIDQGMRELAQAHSG